MVYIQNNLQYRPKFSPRKAKIVPESLECLSPEGSVKVAILKGHYFPDFVVKSCCQDEFSLDELESLNKTAQNLVGFGEFDLKRFKTLVSYSNVTTFHDLAVLSENMYLCFCVPEVKSRAELAEYFQKCEGGKSVSLFDYSEKTLGKLCMAVTKSGTILYLGHSTEMIDFMATLWVSVSDTVENKIKVP